MRRILLITALALPPALALVAFLLHTPLVQYATREALDRAAQKLGEELRVERIEVRGLAGVRLHRLRVGPLDAPRVTIRTVATRVDLDALRGGDVRPTLVELDGLVVHLRSDGTPRGLVDAARALIPQGLRDRAEAAAADGDTDPRDGLAARLPDVIVRGAQLIDHGGVVDVIDGALTLSEGRLTGTALVRRPDLGACRLDGSLLAVDLECEHALARELPGGFRVEGRRVELARKPRPAVRLPGIRLAAADTDDGIGAVLGGLSAELRLVLTPDADGRYPLETRLVLPGGGQIAGAGTVDKERITLAAEVADLEFGRAHEAIGGSISGSYRLDVDLVAKRGWLEGRGRATGLTVQHPAIADGPVGPFDMAVRGRLDARLLDRATRAIEARITGGRFEIGGVGFDFEAAVDTTPDAWTVDARLDTGTIDGATLADAIPPGLLPHLQPIEAKGPLSFKALLAIDKRALADTKLEIDVDTRRLKVEKINPAIDFEALRDVFTTRFEMPPKDGEEQGAIIERETGPNSARWTPLEALPPLLPAAVTAQEDGGFYRHGGVSLLHLRGSLIRNLERGRFARGGSTITMQLARNLFLTRKKTLARKLEEVILTWLLEREFNKDELMTLYLNVVEFGPEVFGIGDAAVHYFGKPPIALRPGQIAWLVRLLPNPRGQYKMFEDKKLPPHMVASVNRLLRRLVERGALPEERLVEIGPEDIFTEPTQPEDAPWWPQPLPGQDPENPDAVDPEAPVDPDAPADPEDGDWQ
ncbi:MAG: transglycosylase domain-containing protein [Myxococcales bacterium]|nr:transglycosylase domain-containing protein [Myxococcales bacterium]